MSKPVLKGAGAGCLGCGCLFVLGGLVCFVLVAVGAINYSEEATVGAMGVGDLCCGFTAFLIGGILLFLGTRPDETDGG